MAVWRCWRRGQLGMLSGVPEVQDDKPVGSKSNHIGDTIVHVKRRLVLEHSGGLIAPQLLAEAVKKTDVCSQSCSRAW
eukprot:10794348-Lingulodinium_polyedra.AAC.1